MIRRKTKNVIKTLIISEGDNHRELVEIIKNGKKKKSRTYHQTKKKGSWVNNTDLKRPGKQQRIR